MSQKTYLYILKIGAFLALTPIFFVFKNLLFPFITSKQIPFNILIEVLLVFWVALIVKYPEYNPFKIASKKNLITYGLIAFFSVMTLTCFSGVDFNLSFWGDIERMLGAFHILHFFGLYLILITVFRDWKDWKEIFIWSLILSVILSLKGISGSEYSTLGNSSYVSGYLIFNMYFAVLLFFKEKNSALRWLYLLPLIFQFLAFEKAGTSGAMVGLGFSILFVLFLYSILQKNKQIRIYSLSALVLISVIIVFLLMNKDGNLVQNTPILKRTVGDISLQKNTFQTRLISWKAAYLDFKTHPLLGVGHGNYSVVFDKYFDPVFLNYTDQETYFDRAHNNVIDIASTTGIIGLIAYLSIFLAVAYYMIMKYRAGGLSLLEFCLITGLFTAYFIQNLAVFDSLATYLMLMLALAYVHWLTQDEEGWPEHLSTRVKGFVRTLGNGREMENREIYALVFAGVIMAAVALQYNIKPWQMLIGTIEGQRHHAGGQFERAYEIYRETLAPGTVLDRDSRTSFIRIIISNPGVLKNLEREKAEEILNFAIEQSQLNLAYNEGDSLAQMMMAQLYNVTADYYRSNADKFSFYVNRALESIDRSIAASPRRVTIYYQKAQIQITQGNLEGALETLHLADEMNPNYYESPCYLGKTYYFYQKPEEAAPFIDRCIDLNGAQRLAPASLIKNFINDYVNKEDWERVIRLYVALSAIEPKDPEVWIKLAGVYKQQGMLEEAKTAALKAAEIDPSVKENADRFIESLE